MNKKFVSALVCAISMLTAAPAVAQSGFDAPRQVVVQFSDLDVSREPGARILLARLEGAARKACGNGTFDGRDLGAYTRYRVCLADTMKRAVAEVDRPLVSELFLNAVPETVAKQTEPNQGAADTR